jgi:site-specific recombinase XerD
MTSIRGLFEKLPGSGIWWIRWTDSRGQLHREKAGRRSDAILLLAKRRTATLQQQKLPEKLRSRITFDDLCGDAIEHSKASNTLKVTHDFELKVAELRPHFGSRQVSDITKQEIVRWLTAQAEHRKWAASTQNRWQAAFSLIFRVGIDNEKIDRNPAAGIRRKTESNARVRFLSSREEADLRKVILSRFPAFIPQLDISIHTGMRAGEQFGLKWNQIDFERRILTLPKTKNGRARHIPLNTVAISALIALKETGPGGGRTAPIFASHRNYGSALQSARGWFKSALGDARIEEYTWHCNRHTFASRLVMAGVDIRTVGELLGHRSLAMTMRYSHLAPAHNAAAVDRLVPVPEIATDTITDTGKL